MSLPCLAFSREPLCIGAAAGRRPDRSRQSGRGAGGAPPFPPGAAPRTAPGRRGGPRETPLFRRLERLGGLLLVYLVVYRGQGVSRVRDDPCGKARRPDGPAVTGCHWLRHPDRLHGPARGSPREEPAPGGGAGGPPPPAVTGCHWLRHPDRLHGRARTTAVHKSCAARLLDEEPRPRPPDNRADRCGPSPDQGRRPSVSRWRLSLSCRRDPRRREERRRSVCSCHG